MRSAECEERSNPSIDDCRADLVETPCRRNRAARGALAGILLGAALWGGILISVGVIKL
jgi:hypothetical protein